MDESKACSGCGETKPLSDFHRRLDTPGGRVSRCKSCRKANDAERYASMSADQRRALADKQRARIAALTPEQRESRRRANREFMRRYEHPDPESLRKYQAEYQREHRESIKKYKAQWRLDHAEELTETARAWRIANPEARADAAHRRRARKLETTTGPVDMAALWDGFCGICGEVIDAGLKRPDPMSKSIDHIVPFASGGTHTQDNLQWAHLVCNLRKGAS